MTSPSSAGVASGGDVVIYHPHCPTCRTAVQQQATVEAFGDPPKWSFWGYQGQRWVRCKGQLNGYEYTHFVVQINGAIIHRLAWCKAEAKGQAEQLSLL